MPNLEKYGLTERFSNEATMYPEYNIARVIFQNKGIYKIVSQEWEVFAEISGKFHYEHDSLSSLPAVGDFVMFSYKENDERAIIHNVLTRKSSFERKAVGIKNQTQIIAANIDIIFICMSLNNNYNLNRIERYLAIAWDSGATPVVVLTKSDLCTDIEKVLEEIRNVAPFTDVITTSVFDNDLVEKFQKYICYEKTASFIGSSGVGKSSLINKLFGKEFILTKEIDKYDKGRHTTTGRELFLLPDGGVVIDTPGIREIGVESADLNQAFSEIEELAKKCKFSDCTHKNEPGCAVTKAVEEGVIDNRRFENYLKLKIESGYEGLTSKEIEIKKTQRMFKEVGGIKNAKRIAKNSKK